MGRLRLNRNRAAKIDALARMRRSIDQLRRKQKPELVGAAAEHRQVFRFSAPGYKARVARLAKRVEELLCYLGFCCLVFGNDHHVLDHRDVFTGIDAELQPGCSCDAMEWPPD